MNEFLGQFLVESREFVEQATEGLLVLEQSPHDAERLDAVFRAFHTLKGGAGIVDFAAMERAVHAAEDVLSDVRSGKRVLTPVIIGDCLSCLDQVEQWLDTLEETRELPAAGDAEAQAVVGRLRSSEHALAGLSPGARESADQGWVADILLRHPGARAAGATALLFIPDADSFYQGEDPIARITSLPGLLALDIEPLNAWPAPDVFDPYRCNLVLTVLTTVPVADVIAHMKGHTGTCELQVISGMTESESSLPVRVRDVLKAQLALLERMQPENFTGHVGSAGAVAENVLRYCGRIGHAELLGQATDESLHQRSFAPLSDAIAEAISSQQAAAQASESPRGPEGVSRTLRIDADRIDALVRLTGQLTVAKNAIGHVLKLAQSEGNSLTGLIKERHGELDHLIGDLQRAVIDMRVLPLRSVLQRLPRVLRDLSSSLGKPARLLIEGDDTEADKAIIEMLFEPLLHVVRNAVDHGIETQAVRASLGKPSIATLQIRTARRADGVLIEILDDGGGIDVDRVREVAASHGIVTEKALRTMPDAEVIDLIFKPGFSTAPAVTGVSGRGVGMDAVRTAVERIGGRVSVESLRGQGTTVRFALPYSVMLTPVMTVHAGTQIYGVPLDCVVETIRISADEIVKIGAARAIVLRDQTIPLLDLGSVLGVEGPTDAHTDLTVVVASFAGQLGGFRVDRVGERLEVILKPLEGLLVGVSGIMGTTLLGDGRVLLVLDVGELLQ